MRAQWLLVFGVLVWACVLQFPALGRTEAPDEGRGLYVASCASCHGIDGSGNGPAAPALNVRPPDLTALTKQHGGTFPRQLVLEVITGERQLAAHGSREMPVWSQRFQPSGGGGPAVAAVYMRRRLEMLIDYVESLQRAK